MKLLLILLFLPMLVVAQTAEEAVTKASLANINSLLIFTSEAGLNSGNYNFTKPGFTMKSYALPFRHHLKSNGKSTNWFVNGGGGYSVTRLKTEVDNPDSRSQDIKLTFDNKLQTYTGGIGGGIRYQDQLGIDWLASMGIIYSRVGTSIKPTDEIGEIIKDFFDAEYNDNISYKAAISGEYEQYFSGFRVYTGANFKIYETKSDFSFDALTRFSSQSNITSINLGVESPALVHHNNSYLALESYIKGNYLQGSIVDVVQFKNYYSVGAVAYWYTPNGAYWVKRLYTEVSTVLTNGLEGYNIGLSFDL